MDVLCTATPCTFISNATCIFYEGANLVYTGINTNDDLQTIIEKLNTSIIYLSTNISDYDNYISQTITSGITAVAPSENVIYNALLLKVDKVVNKSLILDSEILKLSDYPVKEIVPTLTKWLRDDMVFAGVPLPVGNFLSYLYLSEHASATVPYREIDFYAEATETIKSIIVNNNEVAGEEYLFSDPIGLTEINSGVWTSVVSAYVDSIDGISYLRYEAFLYHIGGTTTTLFSVSSIEIDSLVPYSYATDYVATTNYPCLVTDRLGIRVFAGTTRTLNTTVSYIIGDGVAAHFSAPIPLRHSQIVGLNSDPNTQHLTAAQVTNLNNQSGINTGNQDISGKEDIINKSTDVSTDGTSDIKYSSAKSVKTYVDSKISDNYAKIVYIDTIDPSIATIFDLNNPPITNDNLLKVDINNLYIGTDASTWVYSTTLLSYITKSIVSSSNFYLSGTVTDAGSNKINSIGRIGNVSLGTVVDNGIDKLQVSGTVSGSQGTLSNQFITKTQLDLKEDTSNKVTTFTGNETSISKFPVVKAIIDYFSIVTIKNILGITTLSGSNTGDQDISGKANLSGATFTGNIIVPNATLSTQAVNKSQLDAVNTNAVLLTGNQSKTGFLSFIYNNSISAGLVLNNYSTSADGMLIARNYSSVAPLINGLNFSTGNLLNIQNQNNGIGAKISTGANGTNGTALILESVNGHGTYATPLKITENGIIKASFSSLGDLSANSFIKSGGTASQFLKADGSVDSSSYGSGSGTVTSISGTNGVTVATGTTTPVIGLGAITPTSTNGVTAATMAYMDATSSVQTQLNDKAPATGSANYIQNQNASAQTADMWISGTVKINGDPTYSSLIAGSVEIQTYTLNNSWLSENIWFNGSSWLYRNTGYGNRIDFNNGVMSFLTYPSNTIGTNANSVGITALSLSTSGAATFSSSVTATNIIANATVRLKGYTVATLPTGIQGDTAFVTDALAPSFMVMIAGGGTVVTKVFYNGTNWIAD